MSLPDELQRREDRLAAIAAAKAKIEARAAERYAREQADYQAKLAARAAKAAAGRKPGGKAPKAPTPGPRPTDQINLTDEESRIMPVAGGGFEQGYNAQALVDTETMLVLIAQVVQAANDKQQVAPKLEKLQGLPEEINQAQQLLADAGYFSETNVSACEAAGIAPSIAIKRDEHHPHWSERFANPEAAPPADATPVERMAHRLKTRTGRATYGLRKQTVEPVFGILKSVTGVPPVSHPRSGQRAERVDPGVPGVEPQAHGRIAPAVREKPRKTAFFSRTRGFFATKCPPMAPCVHSRGSSPTAC